MKEQLMANYSITLTINLDQVKEKLKEGQTFDEYVTENFINELNDKLKKLNIQGCSGFSNYAHTFVCKN